MIIETLLMISLALAIGLLMGIIGGGGGGAYVIVLMLLLKLDLRTAIGTALILSSITLSGAAWQYIRRKQVRWDYFAALTGFGIIGVIGGSFLITYISEAVLKILILVVFVLSGASSLIKAGKKTGEQQTAPNVRKHWPLLAPLGCFSGLITGSMGLSGTTPLSSLLIGIFDFIPHIAVGTTILVTLVLNLTGAVFHLRAGINLHVLLTFAGGSLAGAIFGAKIAAKINRKILTVILALLAILSGIFMEIHQ
jgi:uncharacterized membrane protein YfcA